MPRRENTFRVDYSQFPKQLSHEEIHKFVGYELGLTRENVLLLQPSRRLGCTFVEVNNLALAEAIVEQHDSKHEFVFDGKAYKLRITMEDGSVEVRLYDLSSEISNEQIAEFLTEYGEVLHVRDLLWDERSPFGGVKTGVRIARMIVRKNIPSLVSIQGEDTAVGYKGQRQTCLHCQEFVHVGIPCVQNKKLLAQKLTADQSYASVTKQSALPTKTKKPPHAPPMLSKPQIHQTPSSQSSSKQAQEVRVVAEAAPKNSTMAPPAVPLAREKSPATQRKADGNETDSSQSSCNSSSSRRLRSRRSPPGKKMRHSEHEANTERDRASGDGNNL